MPETSPAFLSLQKIYGGPEVTGMGSSVTEVALPAPGKLEEVAKERYQKFCGEIWERFGPDNWLSQWAEVYSRPAGQTGKILEELRGLKDHTASMAGSMILDNIDEPEAAHITLSQVFDDPAIERLSIFRLGDGEAYSGILIAADRGAGQGTDHQAVFLTFLMD
jgi:hypothetical protein